MQGAEEPQPLGQVSPPAPAAPSQLFDRPAESASKPSSTTPPIAGEQEVGMPAQTSSIVGSPIQRSDYAWLSETIMRRMHELKRYPADARLDRAEGRVVLKAVIRSNGSVDAIEVFQSSGHQSLDKAAVDLLNLAAPFHFPRPMEKPQMTVKIPMSYRLEP
jgi:protein TonB